MYKDGLISDFLFTFAPPSKKYAKLQSWPLPLYVKKFTKVIWHIFWRMEKLCEIKLPFIFNVFHNRTNICQTSEDIGFYTIIKLDTMRSKTLWSQVIFFWDILGTQMLNDLGAFPLQFLPLNVSFWQKSCSFPMNFVWYPCWLLDFQSTDPLLFDKKSLFKCNHISALPDWFITKHQQIFITFAKGQ